MKKIKYIKYIGMSIIVLMLSACGGSGDNSQGGTSSIAMQDIPTGNNVDVTGNNIDVNIKDTTPPVITLNGESLLSVEQNTSYEEFGATAVDTKDGNVEVTISGTVDTSVIGVYSVTYSAKDLAGNKVSATRTVHVVSNGMAVQSFQFPALKDNLVLVRVHPFGEGSYSSIQGNIDFDSDRNMSDNYTYDYFQSSDENITITAIPKDNSKVRTWIGCDQVSQDKTECTVSLKTSHEITPIFEYKDFITVDNLYNMSNVKSMDYDWNITTQLEANRTIEIFDDNQTRLNQLDQIAVGDYINYSNPKLSFLRKVNSVEKIDEHHYRFVTDVAPLNEVIIQGTIFSTGKLPIPVASTQSKILQKNVMENNEKTFALLTEGGDKGDGFAYQGGVRIEASFDFGFSIKGTSIKSAMLNYGGGLRAQASGHVEKTIPTQTYNLFDIEKEGKPIIVGPFKINFVRKISSKVSLGGETELVSMSASASAGIYGGFKAGYHYDILTGYKKSSSTKGEISYSASLNVDGNLKLSIPSNASVGLNGYYLPLLGLAKLSGEVGLSSKPYIEIKALCNECAGTIKAHYGVETDVFAKVSAGIVGVNEEIFTAPFKSPIEEATMEKELFNTDLETCELSSGDKPGEGSSALFTAIASWKNPVADLILSSKGLKNERKLCTSATIDSGEKTLFDIIPGTLKEPLTYSINISAGDDTEMVGDKDLPDTVSLFISIPGATWTDNYTINSRGDYNLGHMADIHIWAPDPKKPPVIIPVPANNIATAGGGYTSYNNNNWDWNFSSGVREDILTYINTGLCADAESCGCLPCEYKIIPDQTKSTLGPISGGSFRIYKASDFGNVGIEYLYEGETSIGEDIITAGNMEIPVVLKGRTIESSEEAVFMQKIQNYDGDFIIEVSGGLDIDANDDWKVDNEFTPLNGSIHAIISKEQLITKLYKVNILTELSFQVSKDLLGATYDRHQLDNRLNDIAKKILIEKVYPLGSATLNRDDIVYWLPGANKNWLVKNYDQELSPIVTKVHNGEYIGDDAYDYVYGDVNSFKPILGTTWFYVEENATEGHYVGQMKIISEGNTSIESYALEGEGNNTFSIDTSGQIYLTDGAVLDFETKNYYDIFVTATNLQGESRPVLLRILLNDVDDAPSYVEFKDGNISEHAQSGDYVGQVIFNPNSAQIDGYILTGLNKDEFTIDSEGIIRVGDQAKLDYELNIGKYLMVQAHNSFGNSRSANLVISITDIIDAPSIQSFEGHVIENAPIGSVVGELNITSYADIENITFLGDDNSTFSVGIDGEIIVANNTDLDYEKKREYWFYVVANNELGLSRPAPVHITIDNASDVPTLGNDKYHVMYDAVPNMVLGKVTLVDSGASSILKYQLSGEGSENFYIDTNGTLIVNLDHHLTEYKFKTLYLLMTAQNSEGESLPQRLTIVVDSDRPSLGTLETYIDENAMTGTVLAGTIPVMNSKTPILSMRLEGDGSENFSIDKSGIIKVSENANIDFEQRTSYDLRVYATNNAGESDASHLSINIYDMPDTMKIQGFSSTIFEDMAADALVGLVRILSLGGLTLDHFELSGEGSDNFIIANDAQMRIASNVQFNSDDSPQYHLALVAIATNGEKSNQVYIDISVAESINVVPQIEDITLEVSEATNVGTVLGQTTIVSKTQAVESAWIEGEGSEAFEFDIDGTIKLKSAVDYELRQTYNLTMYARNSLGQSQGASLQINITNILDDEPVILGATFSMDENASVGTALGSIEVSSIGTSAIENIGLSGDGAGYFSVSADGTVKLNQSLDYETTKVYHLTAIATNAKADSEAVGIVINVNNVPETVPVLKPFIENVLESASLNTIVGNIVVEDSGDTPIVNYQLNDVSAFKIDSNGVISVNAALDYETKPDYILQVTAENTAGKSQAVEVHIEVINIVDGEPELSEFIGSVEENASVGTVIGKIDVLDEGNTPITSYVLQGDDGKFKINPNTHEIIVEGILDFEIKSEYVFTIEAVNSIGKSPKVNGIISIEDSPDTVPIVENYTIAVADNSALGSTLGMMPIDSRGSMMLDVIISGDDNDTFFIENDGTIALDKVISFETKNQYLLDIVAVNTVGESNSAVLTVNVLETFVGTEENDSVIGNSNDNALFGFEGNDTIYGNNGDDVLNGGEGNDTLYGNTGGDTLNGGAGDDILIADDEIVGGVNGSWPDTLEGGQGDDRLEGGQGNDTYLFNRGDGHDVIYDYDEYNGDKSYINAGNDTLIFGAGILPEDVMMITQGNDLFLGLKEEGKAWDELSDTVLIVDWYLSQNKIENILFEDDAIVGLNDIAFSGTAEDDVMTGLGNANVMFGFEGNDTITGNSGDDVLNGGEGNDTLYGNTGGDTLNGGAGDDILIADDEIVGGVNGSWPDTLEGGQGDDRLEGGQGNDTYLFNRGDGHDVIYDYDEYNGDKSYINAGNDTLIFGVGILPEDVMMITQGNDLFLGLKEEGKAWDELSDTVLIVDWYLSQNKIENILFEDDAIVGLNDIAFSGTAEDDVMTGLGNANVMFGFEGNDTITGNSGDDVLNGGEGNDTLYGNTGGDTLNGGAGDDILIADDEIVGGVNGSWPDTLEGGQGDDRLEGGQGNDTYLFNRGDGHDVIYDYDEYNGDKSYINAGNDTLIFGVGILPEDVMMITQGNDLFLGLKEEGKAWDELSDTVLIVDWYLSQNKIENILFEDDAIVGLNDIAFSGTAEDDVMTGLGNANVMFGFEGNDTITGNSGDDVLNGGEGNDTLYGNTGGDTLNGGAGDDILIADDEIVGGVNGSWPDTLEGGQGDDRLEGGQGNDTYLFNRGDGHDVIYDYDEYNGDKSYINAGNDTLIFGVGILPEDVSIQTSDTNITVGIKEVDVLFDDLLDTITIINWHTSQNSIETFSFDDGTQWDEDTIFLKSQ